MQPPVVEIVDIFGQDLLQMAEGREISTRGSLDCNFAPFRLARITAYSEEMPNPENRVELATENDEFGMPLGRIIHSYDQDAVALWNANFDDGLNVAKATGSKEFWSARDNMPTTHLFGGTIMGTSASNSVVDSYGQTHEITNLWIARPGIFPTEGASNPAYTIFALSQRGAGRSADKWRSVAG